jgi:hypothetical protein
VSRVASPRFTRMSTILDIEGSASPMCSAISESDAFSCLLKKRSVRNCGTETSPLLCVLNSPRIARITSGTTSSTSRAHSLTEDCIPLTSRYFDFLMVRISKYLHLSGDKKRASLATCTQLEGTRAKHQVVQGTKERATFEGSSCSDGSLISE